jgi:hypothetical protein
MKWLSGLWLILIASPVLAMEPEITEVQILNSQFETIRVIQDPVELQSAEKVWRELKPIDKLPNTNWTHKLDITSPTIGGRWLYNRDGYLARLNKRLQPMYMVSNVERFNMIFLGRDQAVD